MPQRCEKSKSASRSASPIPSPDHEKSRLTTLDEECGEPRMKVYRRRRSETSRRSRLPVGQGSEQVRALGEKEASTPGPVIGRGDDIKCAGSEVGSRADPPKELREIVDKSIPDTSLNYMFLFFLGILDDDLQPFVQEKVQQQISESDYKRLQQFVRTLVPRGVKQEAFDQVLAEKSALEIKEAALSAEVRQRMDKEAALSEEVKQWKILAQDLAVALKDMRTKLFQSNAKNAALEVKAATFEAKEAEWVKQLGLAQQQASEKEQSLNDMRERAQRDKLAMEAALTSMEEKEAASCAEFKLEKQKAARKANAINQNLIAVKAEVVAMGAKNVATEARAAELEAREAKIIAELKHVKCLLISAQKEADEQAHLEDVNIAELRQEGTQLGTMVDTLVHANRCGESQCTYGSPSGSPTCRRVKDLRRHSEICCKTRRAGSSPGASCALCKELSSLILQHANMCNVSKCPAMGCVYFKSSQWLTEHRIYFFMKEVVEACS